MKPSFGALFSSSKPRSQDISEVSSSAQDLERDLLMYNTIKMDLREVNDIMERNDAFFDNQNSSTNFYEAFDSFDDAVFIDDKTHINLEQLDNDLAAEEL